MKRISIILSLLVCFFLLNSCQKKDIPNASFKDREENTIYDYLVENETDFSSFLQILKVAGLDKTLSAYNPGGKTSGVGYTLFVPNNQAVNDFIEASDDYATLEDLLNDTTFVKALARYHVLNQQVVSSEFPFGTFNQPTLSNDFLNVTFDIETADTTIYRINNQAPVIKANIETSNGYIQVIGAMLIPITQNSYEWLKKNTSYSIFIKAIDAVDLDTLINVDMKLENQKLAPFTVLAEPDSIYGKMGIQSFEDLANVISPGRTDYTNSNNPLNLFVNYHILNGSYFLDDLAKASTNYNTFADIPLSINGLGLDIVINKGKEIFYGRNNDSTDYVGMFYDNSNINTQSGAIHIINQVMKPQNPTRAIVTYECSDDYFLNRYRKEGGSFEIEDHSLLYNVSWSDSKLLYVKSNDDTEKAWGKDYLLIEGEFSITYNTPKIIQGKYLVYLQANFYGPYKENAVVEVLVDDNKVGGFVDLNNGGSANNPYRNWPGYLVGTVDFKRYDRHAIKVRSLIPGRFIWDYIRFEPI